MTNKTIARNADAVKRFFGALWSDQEEGGLSVSTNGKSSGLISKFYHHPIKYDLLSGAIQRFKRNVWYTVGLIGERPDKGRGTEKDVTGIPGLWMDIDVRGGVHKETNLPTKDEASAFLNEIAFKPSLLVWSGGGFQPYWIFKEPFIFESHEDWDQAKTLSRRWQSFVISRARERGWRLDNTASLEHLLRVPGTYNHKGDPVLVEIVEMNDFRYRQETFKEFLQDQAEDKPKVSQRPAPYLGKGSNRIWNIVNQCAFLRHCREDAQSLPEPDWWCMVCALCFEGGSGLVIHELSKDYPSYSIKETNSKMMEALKQSGPMTCQAIQEKTGFQCPPEGCGVKCPSHFGSKNYPKNSIREGSENIQWQNETIRRFPRGPFPWEVLPLTIAESLKQLARSCASSPTALPGAGIAIFASLIGSTVSVSPKRSWIEPLIFWFADIRGSGEGKTHPARALCQVLYDAQTQADLEYKAALESWNASDTRSRGEPPARPRGYFGTDLTLEGLRDDHSGHGGKVIILDELSAFISSQNQYKKKGADREAWLCLHDGKAARIIRVGKSYTIRGARVSIFGGIQPQVWKVAFSGEKIYLVDGTVYRVLPVYEGPAFHPLTAEAWDDDNRVAWEKLLRSAMIWGDSQWVGIQGGTKKTKALCLSESAQQLFIDWRNELMQVKDDLPGPVRGFIPKLVGYALRFSGVLYLMDIFSRNEDPGAILNDEHVRKGIKVSEFYLGHIIAAMEALVSEDTPEPFEVTDQTVELAKMLAELKVEIDNGRLAIGYIQERFDAAVERSLRVHNSRFMGSLLRKCGLTISGGRYRANGKTGVYCLVWDEKTDAFIKNSPSCPSCPQIPSISGFEVMEEENRMSIKSIKEDRPINEMMDMMEEKKPMSTGQEPHYKRVCGLDGGDGGVFGKRNEKQPPEVVEI